MTVYKHGGIYEFRSLTGELLHIVVVELSLNESASEASISTFTNESLANESTSSLTNESMDALLLNETMGSGSPLNEPLNETSSSSMNNDSSSTLNETAMAMAENNTMDATTNATTTVRLRVGDITSTETHLYLFQWSSEHSEDLGSELFYVVLPNEERCYLAFESDGSPVENPCSEDAKTKAKISTLQN